MPTVSTRRIKASEVATVRQDLATKQNNRCAICQLPLSRPVLDHDHSTGAVRATLHAGCNSVLGKIENSYKRYGVLNLAAFLAGTAAYLQRHSTNQTGCFIAPIRTKMKNENLETSGQELPEQEPKQEDEWELGAAYCGTDGPCESCQ